MQSTNLEVQSLINRVQSVYPGFVIHSARWLGSGQNNDVVVFNNSWIFRFPHNNLAAINLENEAVILRSLKGILSVKIPVPQYVNLEPTHASRSFMGYQMIAGVPLSTERVKNIDAAGLNILARQLDEFLISLHTLPIPKEVADRVSVTNTFDYWSDMYERIQQLLFSHMRTEARAEVRHLFESFLQSVGNFNLALIHGDFGAGNILVDESSERVVGVIDFGSVGVGDPAVDYAAVSTIHPQMLDLIAIHNPSVEKYIQRIKYYKGTFALQEALYGAETGDEGAFRSGLEQYI